MSTKAPLTLLLASGVTVVSSLAQQPGAMLWSYDVGTTITASPALAPDGTIYVGGTPGLFAVTNNGSGASNKWTFFPGEGLLASPTIGRDGTIYWGGSANFYRQNPRHTGKVEKPLITPPQKRSDGSFGLQLFGQLGDPFTVLASTNLSAWTSLTSFVATTVPVEIVDSTASNFPTRFYRASSP